MGNITKKLLSAILNIKYRRKIGCHSFLYQVDYILDNLLQRGIKSGIKSINTSSVFESKIVFKNGDEFMFWNVNKYYGWLQKGSYVYKEGKYIWKDSRPTVKAIYKLIELIKKSEL